MVEDLAAHDNLVGLCAAQQSRRHSSLAPLGHHGLPALHPSFSACRKWPQEFDYSQEAPRGHLPLTNALRGTRLFEAILEHEAF